MGTYTIKINEKTKKGKNAVAYLRKNGFITDYKKIPVCNEPLSPEEEKALRDFERREKEGKLKFTRLKKVSDLWK